MARSIGFPLMLRIAFGFPWLGNRMSAGSLMALLVHLLQYCGWLLLQFMPLGVLLGFYGFWKMQRTRPEINWLFLTLMVIQILFSANYTLADQFNFHLPSYLLFSFGITWGLDEIWRRIERQRLFSNTGWRSGLYILALIGVLSHRVLCRAPSPRAGVLPRSFNIPIGQEAGMPLTIFSTLNMR
jgi:hypothetical protein